MNLQICLLLFLPFCIEGEPRINTDKIVLSPLAAFSQHVVPGNGEEITKCDLEYTNKDNTKGTVEIQMSGPQTFEGAGFLQRLSNVGRGTCGIRVSYVVKPDPSEFAFNVDYTDSENATKSSRLNFSAECYDSDPNKVENVSRSVRIGDSLGIICSKFENNKAYSCALLNPAGKLIKSEQAGTTIDCSHNIAYTTMDDFGIWKCSVAMIGAMQQYDMFITVEMVDEPKVDVWYKEEDGYGLVGCKFYKTSEDRGSSRCVFTSPDNNMFAVYKQEAATARYTAIGTSFKDNTCQIEILLPLQPSELGLWKCVVDETGGFINTGGNSIVTKQSDSVQYTELGETVELEIKCTVPYSSDNCIITSPEGHVYSGGTRQRFHLGECRIKIKNINASHVGTWTCRFSNPKSSPDDIIKVTVLSYEKPTGIAEVEVREGESADLMCKFSSAINFCQFIDPAGNSYTLSAKKKSANVHYLGAGIDHGECGIKIDSSERTHDGYWTCVAKYNTLNSNLVQGRIKMTVNSSRVMTAASFGIPVGIMAAAVLLLALGLYKSFRKSSGDVRRASQSSAGSNTALPIAGTAAVNYNQDA